METNLIKELNSVLKLFPEFWEGETLLRSKVIDALKAKEPKLIKALIGSEKIKQNYSTNIEGIIIFDFDKLIGLLRFKEYWPDSFTKYRNKIGLTCGGKYLDYDTDVVLSFPFKDCVLEGGMIKEEQGRNEVYYNEVIARDEIDRLFSPKVLTNSKRYTKDGVEENITEFKDDDNLIIKGNNLIALHSLKQRFAGKVKLIYIDPPYNTGNDSFKYNDRFNHSTWLTFMKNRLEVARELLSDDGVIFVQCDDSEQAYLKILMDNVFSPQHFIANFIWKKKGTSTNVKGVKVSQQCEFIICFSKTLTATIKSRVTLSEDRVYPFCDEEGKYRLSIIEKKNIGEYKRETMQFPIKGIFPRVGKRWQIGKAKAQELEQKNRFIVDNNIIKLKIYSYEDADSFSAQPTLLTEEVGSTNEGNRQILKMFDIGFNNPKPENLVRHLINITTELNDIVLDFYLGSGTTAAVAHKMGRRYIGIEQMDYINDITVPRLQKVVDGEQGGISKDVAWQGGGSFVYTELKQLNAAFIEAIDAASSYEELAVLFEEMKAEAHLNYQVELDKVLTAEYDHKLGFKDLILKEQKRLLKELLDKNQLYVNASEMDDATLDIPENDKAFTKSFYGEV